MMQSNYFNFNVRKLSAVAVVASTSDPPQGLLPVQGRRPPVLVSSAEGYFNSVSSVKGSV